MPSETAPNADRFTPLPPDRAALWAGFAKWDEVYFPNVVGVEVEEIRADYARMRLPHRPELNQPIGVVHGGAIASLIDTVVVPAIGSHYDAPPDMVTLTMTIQYLGAVRGDAVAEGWVERRGRSVVFCRAEVRDDDGDLVATASLTYKVRART